MPSNSSRFILGGRILPLDLHTVVDKDGRALAVAEGPLHFDFTFRFIRFAARVETEGGSAHVKLAGDVGPMPFSAESPEARNGLSTIIAHANDLLGPVFRLSQGRILLGGDLPLAPEPLTATGLVTTLARFLVPAIPYLELVALYVRPPLFPAKPGEGALRPEWRRRLNGRGS